MEKQAVSKYVRISPFKAREITRLIQGKPVEEALVNIHQLNNERIRLVTYYRIAAEP